MAYNINNQQIGDIVNSILNDVNVNQQVKDLAVAIQELEFHKNECGKECHYQIDDLKSRIDKLEKQNLKIGHSRFHYFLWGIVILILGTILFFMVPKIQENYVGGILAFVGILATFIVVSNYMQVKSIQDEVAFIRSESNKSIYETKSELAAFVHYVNAISAKRANRTSHVVEEFDGYTCALCCLSDISAKPQFINMLLQCLSKVIEQSDPKSIVDGYVEVNINTNNSCIDLLKKTPIRGVNQCEIIKFIKKVNNIAIKENKANYDDYTHLF
jgi:hypothetical protein